MRVRIFGCLIIHSLVINVSPVSVSGDSDNFIWFKAFLNWLFIDNYWIPIEVVIIIDFLILSLDERVECGLVLWFESLIAARHLLLFLHVDCHCVLHWLSTPVIIGSGLGKRNLASLVPLALVPLLTHISHLQVAVVGWSNHLARLIRIKLRNLLSLYRRHVRLRSTSNDSILLIFVKICLTLLQNLIGLLELLINLI